MNERGPKGEKGEEGERGRRGRSGLLLGRRMVAVTVYTAVGVTLIIVILLYGWHL